MNLRSGFAAQITVADRAHGPPGIGASGALYAVSRRLKGPAIWPVAFVWDTVRSPSTAGI